MKKDSADCAELTEVLPRVFSAQSALFLGISVCQSMNLTLAALRGLAAGVSSG